MLFVVCICTDNRGKTTGALVTDGKAVRFISNSDIVKNKYVFQNATADKNGYVRAKRGSLERRVVVDPRKPGSSKNKSEEGIASKIITVYHGSPHEKFTPKFGFGEDKHDYGKGFYMTANPELAKEWAVCSGIPVGWLHEYKLDITNLTIFDFNKASVLSWLAELMKHRDADTSARYKRLSPAFIKKFGVDISNYDIIYGWRADSSYFHIAKRFVRNEIDYDLLNELLHLGDLDNQICLKSAKAFNCIKEVSVTPVSSEIYLPKYISRDSTARKEMVDLIDSDRNTMKKTFDYVLEADKDAL